MRRVLGLVLVAVMGGFGAPPPEKAEGYLRRLDSGFEVEIRAAASLRSSGDLKDVQVTATIANSPAVSLTVGPSRVAPGDLWAFRAEFPNGTAIKAVSDVQLTISNFLTSDGIQSPFKVDPLSELTTNFMGPACANTDFDSRFTILITPKPLLPRPVAAAKISALLDELKALKNFGVVKFPVAGWKDGFERKVTDLRFPSSVGGIQICVQTEPFGVAAASYEVTWTLPAEAPFELGTTLIGTVAGVTPEQAIRAGGSKSGKFEKNLDISALYSSSVEDVKDGDTTARKRKTQGALDLKFAPVLNWLATTVKKEKSPIFWWTPFALDAKVATGSITKDTLALNRIVASSEVEMRYYFNTKPSPDLMRHIFRVANASDRDFKQAELKAVYEFQPVIGKLNQRVPILLDKTGKKPAEIADKMGIGSEFIPVFGVELGRTYTSRRPAVPPPADRTVKRFYFGGNLTLNLTSFATLIVSERLYLRGEAWERDPLHNYFSGEIEVPIGGLWSSSAHDVFVAFERGGQPPFASPDVNAVKLGYRVRMDGWGPTR